MIFTPEQDVSAVDFDIRDLSSAQDSVQAIGPLTDTELRATPVPVSIPTPVPVTDNGGSITVDGSVVVTNFPGASVGVATVTSVPVSTTVATLSASNAVKTKVIIHNENGTLYVKCGSGASASSYTYRLTANATLEIEGYYGEVTGTKQTGASNALVTELGI